MLDLVIRDCRIVDGSGAPSYSGDIGVADGQIVEIGQVDSSARRTIDADGLVASPGFIDGHTHMDAQVFWDQSGTNSCFHGVTTVVMGNCGFTLAPVDPNRVDLVVRNLERAEDISAEAMAEGIPWSWSSFAEYCDAVDAVPKGINYVTTVGHSALRTFAMGERAFEAQADDDDLAVMAAELINGMRAGAAGLSTSRTHHHETSDDRPVASRIAEWGEVRALVETMGQHGPGVFQFVEDPPAPGEETAHEDALMALGHLEGVTVAIGAPSGGEVLHTLDRAVEERSDIIGLTHCRGIGTMSSFATQLPFDRLPRWSDLRRLPVEAQLAQLRDEELLEELVTIAVEGPYGRAIGGEARPPIYDRMYILDDPLPPHTSVAEEAQRSGRRPPEIIIERALATEGRQFFVQPNRPFIESDVLEALRHSRTVMAFSDSGAHVSQMSDASLQTHMLGYWVRRRGQFSLEEAVREMTLVPARIWKLSDRGLLRTGMAADINLFDPDTIGPDLPVVANDLPGGARRIVQTAHGIRHTIVNGQLLVDEGALADARSGRLLRCR